MISFLITLTISNESLIGHYQPTTSDIKSIEFYENEVIVNAL